MSTNQKLRPGGLLFAMVVGIGMAPSAWAQTAASTSVTNTASVDYTVGGVNQADITSNSDAFLVDQLIDLTVAESSTSFSAVTPDQTNFGGANGTLRFTITNTGNATQDIAVLAANLADGATDPHGGPTDSWQAQGAITYYLDLGVAGTFEPGGADTVLPNDAGTYYLDELASGASAQVWVEFADMPANDPGNTLDGDPDKDMDNGNTAVVTMVGTVRAGGGAAALGAVLVNDTGADVAGTAQVVFGDADGPFDAALDAAESDDDSFRVSTAVITISKSSAVVTDPVNCTGGSIDATTCGANNAKRIPGAVIRYTVTVANGAGAASATNVTVTDAVPANTTYVANSLFRSGDATCNNADTALTDAFDAADDGSSVAGTVTFGDSNAGTDLSLAASTSAFYCYHVTID
jgi:uncharacterized repeat protein (TIGR01451 family)